MHTHAILIVDDEPTIRAILRRLFLAEGYTVQEAGNGVEALDRIQQTRFDAVILDFAMPGLLGSDVLRRLRRLPNYMSTPIFVMSGDHDELAHIPREIHDPTYHLPKPLMLECVLDLVSRACQIMQPSWATYQRH